MSVFKSVLAAFRPNPDALELGRGATSPRGNSPRAHMHFTTQNISSPISMVSDSSFSRSASSEGMHDAGIDFNKKLPRPPTKGNKPFAEEDEKLWRRVFRLWIPLEIWAKFVVVLSFCEALMALWMGMQIVTAGKLGTTKFWSIMASALFAWGTCFAIAAYCSFAILWGRWRHSVTAVHVLRLVAGLFSVLYSIASSLFFFYAFKTATETRRRCLNTTIEWDGETVTAPEPWKILCIENGEAFGRLQVGWGFMNALQVYFMMQLIMWAAVQERRLRQHGRWSVISGSDFPDRKSFASMTDIEAASNVGVNFERTVAERVEEFARKERLEKQTPRAVEIGMKIPNFPMPNRSRTPNGLLSPDIRGLPFGRKPSTIPEVIEEVLRSRDESLPRLSGASALSGAIPIALDLRNAPVMYGRAF